MNKHAVSYDNVTNHDQVMGKEGGGLMCLRCVRTLNFSDIDKVVLTVENPKNGIRGT